MWDFAYMHDFLFNLFFANHRPWNIEEIFPEAILGIFSSCEAPKNFLNKSFHPSLNVENHKY